ncbi:MAG TPA: M20 family metallopeptidase [Thermomicrobiales bacterium]|nr:M20 family metallopeptidase [Thermomicrobiales bacterium]
MTRRWEVAEWLDERQGRFIQMSDEIWGYAEIALAETKSCALQAEFLEREGFTITRNVGDLPTAFMAEWGSGAPVIGFLGEYDALPTLSQKAEPEQSPVSPGAPGHGCGHNLLGTASLAAANALKAWLESTGREGTVRYYGCPAEEIGAGKVFMARAGAFDDLDACFTWHPGATNTAWASSSLAIDHIKFRFFGKTAHAAASPELGRSALDAVELTNIGVNYLREHVIESARIHYVITNGGGQPNVVPEEAEVWYYVRAPERADLEPITERVRTIARAAAMMTETRLEEHDFHGLHNYLPNSVLTNLMTDVMQEIEPLEFTDEEQAFAAKVLEGYPEATRQAAVRSLKLPKDVPVQPLMTGVYLPDDAGTTGSGSTDVAEASWVAPTAQIRTTCFAAGTPGHSWGITACGGMSIGHKGMLHAAKIMAVSAAELIDHPELIEQAKAEHREATGGKPYKAPLPDGAMPPQSQLGRTA